MITIKWGTTLGMLLMCLGMISLSELARAAARQNHLQSSPIQEKSQSSVFNALTLARPNRLSLSTADIVRQAKQVTVMLDNGITSGSSVIIQRQSDTYTVLTVAHVVPTSEVPYQDHDDRSAAASCRAGTPTDWNAQQILWIQSFV
jgi:hypothetical protein